MRLVQVSISVERFAEAAPNGKHQKIRIYADANNTYEALCAAFCETLDAFKTDVHLPSHGQRVSSEQ